MKKLCKMALAAALLISAAASAQETWQTEGVVEGNLPAS